ncbi:hypothetical protein V2J09_008382, partial [Rumex salicifolius]
PQRRCGPRSSHNKDESLASEGKLSKRGSASVYINRQSKNDSTRKVHPEDDVIALLVSSLYDSLCTV